MKFLPTNAEEMRHCGWDELDILLVTGDCYVDHPSFGVSLIGKLLLESGYRVGLIAQPDWKDPDSLTKMGRPRLACALTSGNLDSMVNIYTAGRRFRREDAYSENGETGKRPPHALTVYTQLAKRAFPKLPTVIGGMEASMRRVAHYDYWQDKIRPGVLIDSKADILCYGMGERTMPEIFRRMTHGESLRGIPGTAILLGGKDSAVFEAGEKYLELPSFEAHLADKDALMASTKLVESEMNPLRALGLFQRYGERVLVLEPPPLPLTTQELDHVHDIEYANMPHPSYKGRIPAFETIRDSIPAVRGCPGGCAFCGLVTHQGRTVVSRSAESIERQVVRMTQSPQFKGTISDVGGAAGNIYGSMVRDEAVCAKCRRASCLFPAHCPNYVCTGNELVALLRRLREVPGVKHLYINSGIRLDLALEQKELFKEIVAHHVSGHLKVAPEHLNDEVLKLMRKNPAADFYRIREVFERESRNAGKEQYLIPLFISNYPGCSFEEMKTVDDFLRSENWSPQQVQDYIPLPMTMGAAMYYTGKAPDGSEIPVNRGLAERRPQIQVLKRKHEFACKGSGRKADDMRRREVRDNAKDTRFGNKKRVGAK